MGRYTRWIWAWISEVGMCDLILGVKYPNPIFICPTGGNKAYHPEGEAAVARAAKTGGHLEMLATPATTSMEDAIAARGAPVWYQLYASPKWEVAESLVKRAERAGSPVVVVTVDRVAGRNQETFFRLRKSDTRECKACHSPDLQESVKRKPAYAGIDLKGLPDLQSANMSWDFIKRLRGAPKMKTGIKGILTAEDARLAVANGVDGLVVSNHGGRGEDSGRATIDVLPEVVDAVQGKILVLIDGGFRRGTDVAKALAMGANAVGVGRPYLWGLGAFGEAGVAKVLEILRTETRVAMMQCGVRAVSDPARARKIERFAPRALAFLAVLSVAIGSIAMAQYLQGAAYLLLAAVLLVVAWRYEDAMREALAQKSRVAVPAKLNKLLRRGEAPLEFSVSGITRALLVVLGASWVLLALFVVSPVWLPQGIGTLAIVLFAWSAWLVFGNFVLTCLPRMNRAPTLLLALIVWAVAISGLDDNHRVREAQGASAVPRGLAVREHFDQWIASPERERDPRRRYPVVIVAA